LEDKDSNLRPCPFNIFLKLQTSKQVKRRPLKMTIAHITLAVRDLPAAKAFYTTILAPLNYKITHDFGAVTCGFGEGGRNDFWIIPTSQDEPQKTHIAFRAESKEVVEKFHEEGL